MRKACVYAGAMETAHLISSRQITLTMHHRTHGFLLLLLIVAKHPRNHIISGHCIHHGSSLACCHLYRHNVAMKHELGGGMLVQRDAVPMSQLFLLDVVAHGRSGYSLNAFP